MMAIPTDASHTVWQIPVGEWKPIDAAHKFAAYLDRHIDTHTFIEAKDGSNCFCLLDGVAVYNLSIVDEEYHVRPVAILHPAEAIILALHHQMHRRRN